MKKIVIERRGSWIYLVAAAPLLIVALIGAAYGAFVLYFLPALICVIQFIRPTVIVWLGLFGVYLYAALMYGSLFFKDLICLARGQAPSILVDADDSIVFLIFLGFIVIVCSLMWWVRPKWRARCPDAHSTRETTV